MKVLTDTYKYKYKQALNRAKQYGLTFINQGQKGSTRFILKNRFTNEVLERFNDVDKAIGLIGKHGHTGTKYQEFFDKVKEHSSNCSLVKYSFDDIVVTWTNNKWTVKHKGGTAKPMGTKRLAELGYLQHIVENKVRGHVESRVVVIDLEEEGFKPVTGVKKGYYINKYGDVIRKTVSGYKYCTIRREFRAMSDDKKYLNVDIDKEIDKLFWS